MPSRNRLWVGWSALIAITLLSWWMGARHGEQELSRNPSITYGVLLIAALKIRVIVREFMEVRRAPRLLRRLTDGWIALLVVVLLGVYSLRLSMPPV